MMSQYRLRLLWFLSLFCTLCVLSRSSRSLAEEEEIPRVVQSSIGVTATGTPIRCLIGEGDTNFETKKTRILLVSDDDRCEQRIIATMRWFHSSMDAQELRARYTLSAVPLTDPDDVPSGSYPPRGAAYTNNGHPEEAYLWRWIGMHAPDLVVTVGIGKWYHIGVPESKLPQLAVLAENQRGIVGFRADSLEMQIVASSPANVGPVPAISLAIPQSEARSIHEELFKALDKAKFTGPSPARNQMLKRLDRSPLKVAQQLAEVYGKDLGSVAYIPAVAAMGQVRLAKLTGDAERLAAVQQLAAPYVAGDKPSNPTRDVAYAGHLIFAELADASEGEDRMRYIALVRKAADVLLNEDGTANLKKLSSSQMSDAVFMSGPILARAGRLTGEKKYFDAATAHVIHQESMNMRTDDLYRHSPLDEAAWGRGNGFPALGLAMILSDLPEEHSQQKRLLALFQRHMNALAKHQDYTGTWHQVIDHEESYRELSCTCMITFAMARGVQRGWLDDATFRPVIEQAWTAIRTRIAADGSLVDVCTGTGKQKSLRAYLDRTAILGRDPRGGAMALLVAVELAGWRDFSPAQP